MNLIGDIRSHSLIGVIFKGKYTFNINTSLFSDVQQDITEMALLGQAE
jgi:hypothetical protein